MCVLHALSLSAEALFLLKEAVQRDGTFTDQKQTTPPCILIDDSAGGLQYGENDYEKCSQALKELIKHALVYYQDSQNISAALTQEGWLLAKSLL